MPLSVGAPIGSDAYTTAATGNAYANAYGSANVATGNVPSSKQSCYQLRYPRKRLQNTSDYLEIKVFDYVPGEFNVTSSPPTSKTARQRLKPNQNNPKGYILLPIPQNVSDSVSVDWGEDRINPIEAYIAGAAKVGVEGKLQVPSMDEARQYFLGLTNISADDKKAITSYFAGRATSFASANVSPQSLIARTTGQVLNSNLELLFNGVNLRQFQFTFDMAPRSRDEAEEVKQIIRMFKKEMAARSGGAGTGTNTNMGLFITAPSLFQLTYRSGPNKHPFLNTFKPCALTDVAVNYTASGTYATYDDGSPVHIQMGLTFKEINPVYSEDYENEEEATTGVGY